MPYTPAANEILIEINNVKYVVNETEVSSDFYIKSADTGAVIGVDALTAAEAFGEERAWTLLKKVLLTDLAMQPANWSVVEQTAQIGVLATSAITLAESCSGLILAGALGVNNVENDISTFANFAVTVSQKASLVFLGSVAVNDATTLINAAVSDFNALAQSAAEGLPLDFDAVKNCLNAALTANAIGQAGSDALAEAANFGESLLQSFGDAALAFSSAFVGAFAPMFKSELGVLPDVSSDIGNVAGWTDYVEQLETLTNATALGFTPLTASGLQDAETALANNPSVNPGLTSGSLPGDTGPSGSGAQASGDLNVQGSQTFSSPLENVGTVIAGQGDALTLAAGAINFGTIEAVGGGTVFLGGTISGGVIKYDESSGVVRQWTDPARRDLSRFIATRLGT